MHAMNLTFLCFLLFSLVAVVKDPDLFISHSLLCCGGDFPSFLRFLGQAVKRTAGRGPGWLQQISCVSGYSHWGNLKIVKYTDKPVG